MSKMYANESFYDAQGKLLLAKGQIITESMMRTLKRLDAIHIISNAEKIDTDCVQKRLHINDSHMLDYPADILSQVLFNSKGEPWRFLITTLAGYIDWLYVHSVNVSLISLMIAIAVGYSTENLLEICRGSLFHDIGKLAIPKDIILKSSGLSESEKIFMNQHPDLGLSAVKQYGFSKVCTDIILEHHERLDGSGYPHGLVDAEISEAAKIVMIADVVDAITSYRPYRRVGNIQNALELLQTNNTLFSQNYAAILREILNKT